MRVLVQWARNQGTDWEAFDSADWASLPAGQIAALCVQGCVFEADRYLVEERAGGGVVVTTVCDDPVSYPIPFMRRTELPLLAADPAMNGAINTRISSQLWTDAVLPEAQGVLRSAWSARQEPQGRSGYRLGRGLPDALWAEHRSARSPRSWREWTEGLSSAELTPNGRVLAQRPQGRYIVPRGTRTYYANNTARATGAHAAALELALDAVPGGVALVGSGNVGTGGDLVMAATSPVGEPDHAQWPTGSYRCQIDVATTSIDLTFGLLTQGAAAGHFARVDSGLTADLETKVQQEAAFANVGLKLATTGSVSWAAGAASDRFEVLLAAIRVLGHGQASFQLELGEADDFADGPWTAAAPVSAATPTWLFIAGGI